MPSEIDEGKALATRKEHRCIVGAGREPGVPGHRAVRVYSEQDILPSLQPTQISLWG